MWGIIEDPFVFDMRGKTWWPDDNPLDFESVLSQKKDAVKVGRDEYSTWDEGIVPLGARPRVNKTYLDNAVIPLLDICGAVEITVHPDDPHKAIRIDAKGPVLSYTAAIMPRRIMK